MDKYIGKLLGGRYEIIDVVGVGGMAVVYRARCHVLNRFVAVKILKDEFAKDPDIRRRFSIESQAVAKLSHHNIVSVYDVGNDNGVDYIVMELIEGITLKEYMQKKGNLSWQEALFFAQQISRALMHAHSRGVIHQDIKPQNVIILRDGSAKLTDFGIASFATTQETRVVQEAIGSVHYISPEQAKGSTIDFRTDIYSLGVVLYEMLTGKLPFEGETALQVVMQHLNAVPLLPSEMQAGVPRGMDDIVMHAMCANINKRYASAEQFCTDLERIKANPEVRFGYECTMQQDEGETQVLDREVQMAARRTPVSPERDRATAPKERKAVAVHEPETLLERIGERPAVAAIISVVVVAVIALIVVGALVLTGGSGNDKVEVPNFVFQDISAVMADDSWKDNFNVSEADKRVESDKPEGTVIKQSVDAGKQVKKGTNIVLTVSAGGPDVDNSYPIQDFKGEKIDYVTTVLGQKGVLFRVEQEDSADVESGSVTRTEPAAGASLAEGQTLVVWVSKGQEKIKMPGLTGRSQDEARQILESNGLKMGTVEPVESNMAIDTIVEQSVKTGNEVSKGTAIDLKVSKGPATVTPPTTETPGSGSGDGEQPSGGEEQPTTPTTGTASVTVVLPTDIETAHVVISSGGQTLYEGDHATANSTVTIPVTGPAGSHEVTITVDGQSAGGGTYTFN